MGPEISDGVLRRVWNEKTIPVVLRRGKGQRIRMRLPYSKNSRLWLQIWAAATACLDRTAAMRGQSKARFNEFVTRALEHYKQL